MKNNDYEKERAERIYIYIVKCSGDIHNNFKDNNLIAFFDEDKATEYKDKLESDNNYSIDSPYFESYYIESIEIIL